MRDDATVYSSVTLTNVMGDNISNGTGQALVSEEVYLKVKGEQIGATSLFIIRR